MSQRELTLNHILYGATFEGLVELVLSNAMNREMIKENSQVGDRHGKHKGNGTQGGKGRKSKIFCNMCRKVGLIAKNCRANLPKGTPKEVKHYNCNQLGHIVKDCKVDQPKEVKCYDYNQIGYMKRESLTFQKESLLVRA